MAKSPTEEMITGFMDRSPIHKTFVLQAIDYYANVILADQGTLRQEMEHHIISPDLWIDIAEQLVERLELFNKKGRPF